jgi:hypothetical protein
MEKHLKKDHPERMKYVTISADSTLWCNIQF